MTVVTHFRFYKNVTVVTHSFQFKKMDRKKDQTFHKERSIPSGLKIRVRPTKP